MPGLLIPPRFGGDALHSLGHAWHLPELGPWQATLWYTPDQKLLQEAKEGEAALTESTALNVWLYRAVQRGLWLPGEEIPALSSVSCSISPRYL